MTTPTFRSFITVCTVLTILGCGSATIGPVDAASHHDATPDDADAPTACGIDCASPPAGCMYVGGGPCSCGTLICSEPAFDAGSNTGPADAGSPDAGCWLGCPVSLGCHYVPPPPDAGCTCGTLVCDDAGTPIVCGTTHDSFPTFDRSCTTDTDCFVALHQTDCCGNEHAMGLNVTQRATFTVDEMVCDRMIPECDCFVAPVITDDQGRIDTSTLPAVAHCIAGTCTTTVY